MMIEGRRCAAYSVLVMDDCIPQLIIGDRLFLIRVFHDTRGRFYGIGRGGSADFEALMAVGTVRAVRMEGMEVQPPQIEIVDLVRCPRRTTTAAIAAAAHCWHLLSSPS